VRHQRLDARRRGPGDVEVARQRHRAGEIIKKYGADVLRLWVASVEFNEDVRMSETILTRLTEAYRKLRNTFRYALGNLPISIRPSTPCLGTELLELDQWILVRTADLVRRCRSSTRTSPSTGSIKRCTTSPPLTSAPFTSTCSRTGSTPLPRIRARRSAQTALYRVVHALVRLLAPLLSFTCDEVWSYLPKPAGSPASVHLTLFPGPGELTAGLPETVSEVAANWDRLMEVREQVNKSLEAAREGKFIGANLQARVHLRANGNLYPLLERYAADLPALFIVSQVLLEGHAHETQLSVHVERAEGGKCERCWKYTGDIGSDPDFPTVCAACAVAINEAQGGR
jgi:isoleucyl-tRNA synthetase